MNDEIQALKTLYAAETQRHQAAVMAGDRYAGRSIDIREVDVSASMVRRLASRGYLSRITGSYTSVTSKGRMAMGDEA